MADNVNQNPDASREVMSRASEILKRMRFYRRQFDQRRAMFYRQYLAQRDAQKYPDNITLRSNTFVPYPLSNVETIVSRVLDAFFSFTPWFECDGDTPNDEPAAEKMELVLNKKLHQANLIGAMEDLIRNIAIYGHGGIKVDWDWDFDVVTKPQAQFLMDPHTQQPVTNPQTGQPIVTGVVPMTTQVPRSRPKFTAIDIYDLMIDPDGGYVAHLTEKTVGQLVREAQAYQAKNNQELYYAQGIQEIVEAAKAKAKGDPMSVIVRLAELWDKVDQTCTIMTFGEDADVLSWKDLRASYRTQGYTPYKREALGGEPILLWTGPNPYAHKRAPILYTSYIKLPNEVYGIGAIEIISDLTESLNKMVNMITDNWNLGINRRYAYNTESDIDHEALNAFNVPGGKVGVTGNPKDVIEPLPFFTPEAGDYQLLEIYKAMIESSSGVSDFYNRGVGSPTGNGTATGINQIINESNFRFKMFIRNLELDVLQPLLEMCSAMVQQYMSDQEEVQITEDAPGIPKWVMVQPAEVIGSLKFSLVAANYATNKVVRQRNLMAFLQILMENAPQYINVGETIREVAKVMEVRNINKMIKPDQQVQMEQQQQQAEQVKMMILESMLNIEGKARLQQSKPQPFRTQGKGGGRTAYKQPEGKIPGAGLETSIRSFAESMGLQGLGLGGLGEGK